MGLIQSIKNLFKKGGYALGDTLKSINEHDKINIDPNELARIERNFAEYRGEYPKIKYRNSMGNEIERDYIHLNMMNLVSELMSGLVFNEQCEITVSDAEDEDATNTYSKADDFIQHVIEHNDFKKNLMRYLEPMFAVGGIAVRPYVNESDEIEFSWALANAFFPLRSNSNGISEGVFKSVTTKMNRDKATYYTLLEFHEWEGEKYVITNELYKSDNKGEVGKQVSLSELYEDLQERTEIIGLSRPLFNYLKPAGFNNINPHSPLGLGITDNCKGTLKQINDAYDQFNWEIRMGQRTVFVSDQMIRTIPDENGVPPKEVFDTDVNVFKMTRMEYDQEFVKDVTSDIRTEQYIGAINHHLKTLEMDLQLSVGTFSFDGRSMKTATEVVSENSLTYRTRNNHVNEVEKFIKGLIISVLELAKAEPYNLFSGEIPSFEHIGVDFDDGVFQDRNALLNFYGRAKTFGLIPTIEIIQRVFKVPKETAEEWLKDIQEEQTEIDPTFLSHRATEEMFGEEE